MEICLVRIDDRLIHGQVATVWTKHSKANRIIVVSDEVATDELRKLLLTQAAPPEVKVSVIPVQKLIDTFKDVRLLSSQARIMLLFTKPADVCRVVEQGIPITEINVGGMSFQIGKKMITNAVAVDEQDIEAFQELDHRGIPIEIRKVVADQSINLIQLLKKEKLI